MSMIMIVVRVIVPGCVGRQRAFADVVMVKMKEPLQKEHEQETGQGPAYRAIDRVQGPKL